MQRLQEIVMRENFDDDFYYLQAFMMLLLLSHQGTPTSARHRAVDDGSTMATGMGPHTAGSEANKFPHHALHHLGPNSSGSMWRLQPLQWRNVLVGIPVTRVLIGDACGIVAFGLNLWLAPPPATGHGPLGAPGLYNDSKQ